MCKENPVELRYAVGHEIVLFIKKKKKLEPNIYTIIYDYLKDVILL